MLEVELSGDFEKRSSKTGVLLLVGAGLGVLCAIPFLGSKAISHFEHGPSEHRVDSWADDQFTSEPALNASRDAQEQIVELAKIQAAKITEASRSRGVGSCERGDKLQLLGGLAQGAAGTTVLSGDPADEFEAVLASSPEEQADTLRGRPLHYDWRGGCEGTGQVGPMTAYLAEPLGGGQIHGGKFLAVSVSAAFVGVTSQGCLILVPAEDVSCEKG